MQEHARRWGHRLVAVVAGLMWIGCGKSCTFSCNSPGGDGTGSNQPPFMLLEFCLSTLPDPANPDPQTSPFPVSVTFTGTQSGAMPAPTFTASAQGIVQPNQNRTCVSTNANPPKTGSWSVVASNIAGWSTRGPLTCPGTNPGTVVFDVSSGQLQCGTNPF